MPVLLIFGDSVTYGYADPMGGWAQRIRVYVDELDRNKNDFTYGVYNLGIDSENSKYLTERIANEGAARARVWSSGVYTLLSSGINDCAQVRGEKSISLNDYKKNLKSAIEAAKGFSDEVIVFGLTPIDDKRTNPVCWDKDVSLSNLDLEEYNNTLKKVAKELKISFIDIWQEVQRVDWQSFLIDGVHPNEKGHQFLFSVFNKELQRLGLIKR